MSSIEKKTYSLLIFHPGFSKNIRRFIRRLKMYNNNAQIEFLTTCSREDEIPADIGDNVNRILYIDLLRPEKCRSRYLRIIYNYFHVKRQIKELSLREHYDIINIHYPNVYMAFGAKYYKKMCDFMLLTPWGSDVYQIKAWEKFFIKKIYEESDKVTGIGNKFTRDYQKLFNVPDEKIVNLSLASETAEFINNHKDIISQEEAKDKLGIKGYYGIVCSYNGNPIGNHIPMFDAIRKIQKDIPEPIMILVQITYGYTEQYLEKLKCFIKENDLKAIFFDKYLSQEDLYCLMKAADMFVFTPDSDSNSAVLKEYIYLGKKVVLGEWLQYDDLTRCNPQPYFTTKSLTTLSETIKEAYFSEYRPVDLEWKKSFENSGYDYWSPKWDAFYYSCKENTL